MIRIIIIAALLTSVNGCGKLPASRYAIYVHNQSPESIECYFALGGNFGTQYPDTVLPASNRYLIDNIKAGDRFIYDSRLKWEEVFQQLPGDTLSIYIFDSDILASYPWEVIRNEYKILKRYDLSLEDLKRLKRNVTYPPTEEMKDMKQFPPY